MLVTPADRQIRRRRGSGRIIIAAECLGPTDPPGSAARVLRADAGGFVALDRLPHGRYALRVEDPSRGWLRDQLEVDPSSVTVGMSITLRALLRYVGDVDERAIGVDVPETSELAFEWIEPDRTPLTRTAICAEGGGFAVDGLLPGRYRVTLGAPQRLPGAHGRHGLVAPALSGIVVPPADVEVPEHDVSGAVLSARR